MSTLVTRGHSHGIVVKIGKQTEIGTFFFFCCDFKIEKGKISKELTEGKGKKKSKGSGETTQLQVKTIVQMHIVI